MTTQQTIDRIIRFDSDGLPVVSVYVTVGPDNSVRTRMTSLLNQIRPESENHALAHDARLSLRGDLERITRAAAEERWDQGMMALFSCHGRDFFEEISLPRAMHDRAAVDATPFVRPMLAVLDSYHRMCVVVVDDAAAQIWELYQRDIRLVDQLRDHALRKPNYAYGRAEPRIHNKVEELAKQHHRRVAGILDNMFQAQRFDLLAIGGQPYEVAAFTEEMPLELRQRIAGTFAIDAAGATPGDIRRSAESVMERYEQDAERRLVADIVDAVAERRPAALGLESCLWAGTVAAIEKLAVQEGAEAPGVVCDRSGWLALEGETCPLCGQPTRPTTDIIDELVEAVINDGGSVEHVEVDTELSEHMVGARLRFPLPQPLPA